MSTKKPPVQPTPKVEDAAIKGELKTGAITPNTVKGTSELSTPTTVEFWNKIFEIRREIGGEGYGKSGGGRDFKDSEKLRHNAAVEFEKHQIAYDILPTENVRIEPIMHTNKQGVVTTQFIVGGIYTVRWFLRGELVYETQSIGSTNLESAAQSTGGSVTNAKTNALFTMIDATVKSDEEFEADLKKQTDSQAQRPPATPQGGYGGNPYKTPSTDKKPF